jgi:NADPH:quinone reductase-like Zn-dependent oxidoreductase
MSKAVLFHEIGGPEVLRVEEVPTRPPGEAQVRLRVEAFGLNRAEAMLRSGTYYYRADLPAARLGYEASGIVDAVGPGVRGFAPGDAVSTLSAFRMEEHGVYGEYATVPAAALVRRAATVDPVTGAAVWLSHTTAYGALVERGGLRPGDTVVITAASGSVGIAAIQIARHLGAIPIATTRTGAKRRPLLDAGAAHVVVTGEEDLPARVLALTEGRGAELVFEAIGGPFTATAARAVAPGGTLVVYGWQSLTPTPLPLNWPLNVFGYGNDYVTDDPARLRRAEHFINAGLRSGAFTPVIGRVFDGLDEVVAAHRLMESGAYVGKIVVTLPQPSGTETADAAADVARAPGRRVAASSSAGPSTVRGTPTAAASHGQSSAGVR